MWTLSFLLLVAASTTYVFGDNLGAPIPITRRCPGVFLQGDKNSKVKLEIYLDWACPDCVRSWPHLKEVDLHYGKANLSVIVNPFALPYHRNARLISQVGYGYSRIGLIILLFYFFI